MAHHQGTPEPARNLTHRLGWPQVRSGPLVAGGILAGIGAVAAMAGAATRRNAAWSPPPGPGSRSRKRPPGQLRRLRWGAGQDRGSHRRGYLAGTRTPRSASSAAPLPPADQ